MLSIRYTLRAVSFLILLQLALPGFGQMGITFDIKKPKEYDERVLRSERSDQKKFNAPRRFIQNTVTHYNYFFNANNKLNEILERAKTSFTDDYSKLLPFYNYSLDVTAGDSIQLDSISYKASTGIALHDLRNDWVDNLYLLWGASYYLRKEFDSAYLMFQFINYAFAPKEKDGYYITIGSSRDGNSATSISTKEKNSLPRRVFSEPPSRNDAFIWQIRNFLAQDQLAEAASLIVALRNDPVFPKRLQNDLDEVQAYWFYKQNMWDSAADHLVKALSNATNAQEKARWEYLAAQLYELSGHYKDAEKYYAKVSTHTTDPIMDIYARLYAIRANKDEGERTIDKNVAELLKMAKKDKYVDYQDIIYYMAAQMQLEGKNVDEALALLQKSVSFQGGTNQRNKTFLQLAELSYQRKMYRQAYNFYDSIKLDDPTLTNVEQLTARKDMLGRLATNLEIFERQDSLQKIAAMPEEERKEYIRKLVRDLRKRQGLKDESGGGGTAIVTPNDATMFPVNEPKGEWYFYNASSRTRGQNEFKQKWGSRPNADNWRRGSTLVGVMQNNSGQNNNANKTPAGVLGTNNEITYDNLLARVPLTPERMQASNDSLENAMFATGKLYIQDIEDCDAGTKVLESMRTRFPASHLMDEVLFNLYYCYSRSGDKSRAEAIRQIMNTQYTASNFTQIVVTGKNPQSASNPEATKAYEHIYDLFIEGKFDEAVRQKELADNKYGKIYWTPQLLYIESVYYIRQRDDSAAKRILNNIITQFPESPLKPKAVALIDVLNRRAQIEDELTKMVVTRNEDSSVKRPVVTPPVTVVTQPKPIRDTTATTPPVVVNRPPVRDTTAAKPLPPKTTSGYSFNPDAPYYVVLVLNKVDPVFVNETKNAFNRYNRDTYYNKTFTSEIVTIDAENKMLMLSPFTNAQDAVAYVERTRPRTASDIIPWLRGGKYYFTIMTEASYNILKEQKDLDKYQEFIKANLPGKF